MGSFSIAIGAVFPFLAYVVFGMLLRRLHLVDEPFLLKLNRLLFKAFFPILMFKNMISIEGSISIDPRMLLVAVPGMLLLIFVLMKAVPHFTADDSRRSVIVQGIFRGNFALLGVPLMTSVYGDAGTAMATQLLLIAIPMYNIMAVVVLSAFSGEKVSLKKILWDIITNPLLNGIALGLFCKLLGFTLPALLDTPVSALANLTTPMGICVLGARLTLGGVAGDKKAIAGVSVMKLIAVPALVTIACAALGLRGREWFGLFVYFGAPTAVSSVSMAESMGGDGQLASEIVVLTTAASIVTIFLWILVGGAVGML